MNDMENIEAGFGGTFAPVPAIVVGMPMKTLPVELPAIPPRPVFDDHIEAFRLQIGEGKITNETELKRCKTLREGLSKLDSQVVSGWAEPKRAVDQVKEPLLEGERRDRAAIKLLANLLDANGKAYIDEQDRLAQVEAKRIADERDAADRKKREDEAAAAERDRQEEADLAAAFGDTQKSQEILDTPLPEPFIPPPSRPVAPVTSGQTWARGVRRKAQIKAKVTNPSAVKRAFCSPDIPTINRHITSWASKIQGEPTKEQLATLAKEIGGVEIVLE